MRISGATVLLTGATGGIGRALAHRLAAEGASLVLTGRRTEALDALAAELGARSVAADLSDPGQVRRLVDDCAGVDVLVANAALPASGDLLDYRTEQIDRALAVNLTAPVMLARLLAPGMAAAGRGHLAFIGSMSGKAATPYSSLYTATKFGLRGFAHSLRQDLADAGVGVSLVQPGFVSEAGMFADTGAAVPSGVRTVTPAQVAGAVVRAVTEDRGEINIAPLRLRLRCAVANQFPGFAERARRGGARGAGDAADAARQVVEAQRALR
ncbi:SDR family NAD(P)-dependent oxidoreductase [Streptomyces katsurahamanus]|uniref:SDR family NAD(P)-dependent oxidoreductase n=1 Tax=Streptomyces katsurahamanus TaxID=2577098 RepID=A0ABW9NNV6_9ACTN|nr:SDR family NAD(P)-dependent oxidoreductase [Streptomyces katsurahamanus]MQS34995.1 SDR family NAD(P)-dependent oxidoreductase [Streptomyces katsurahamanus]